MSDVKRARKYLFSTALLIIIIVSSFIIYESYSIGNKPKADPRVYIGVAFGGNTTAQAKLLIDKVNSYTNLFILASGRNPISRNQTAVEEICDYAVSKDLSVIINMGIDVADNKSDSTWFWQLPINETIQRWTERWGNKFLGIYYNDEPGGIQLDGDWGNWFRKYGENLNKMGVKITDDLYQIYLKMNDTMVNGTKPQNYDLEANFFIDGVLRQDPGLEILNNAGIQTFTSDYGLYWFDYMGGYNVLFTELGWNASITEQIAQVKGAARLQNKDWGAMITWKYNETPYLDTGSQIYNQMLMSYQAGAKYITVFNYPYANDSNYGIFDNDQFLAIHRLWDDITQKKIQDLSTPQAAFVLPKNYGWGMRYPNDTIWGFWPTDDKTQQIAIDISALLSKYGVSLDIVYDDPTYPVTNIAYQNIYYWNQTNIQ